MRFILFAILTWFMADAAFGGSRFSEGDLYLATNSYQTFGMAVARIDPSSGQDSLVVDLPWPSGNPIRDVACYCPARDRFVICQAITVGGLTFVDADGGWSQPFPSLETPYAVAARGDGILYLYIPSDRFQYLDAANLAHDLLDSTGTAAFHLGATGFWDEMIYDPGTNSLLLANGDNSGYAGCAAGDQSCFVRLPLSPDGTRVAGAPTSVQADISPGTYEDDVVGSGYYPGGNLAFTVDTNTNNQEPRMQVLDPETMTLSTFASNGYYVGAAATSAGVYSSVRGQWVIRDYLANVLRAFNPGQTGGGTVITDLGAGYQGSVSRLVEIARTGVSTGVAESGPRANLYLAAVPTPFTHRVSVSFELQAPARVRLAVYDVAGREVAVLMDGTRPAGLSTVQWDGRDGTGTPVAAGVYFARLEAEIRSATRRLIVTR